MVQVAKARWDLTARLRLRRAPLLTLPCTAREMAVGTTRAATLERTFKFVLRSSAIRGVLEQQ
jgi:hypothetical protein